MDDGEEQEIYRNPQITRRIRGIHPDSMYGLDPVIKDGYLGWKEGNLELKGISLDKNGISKCELG